MYFSSIYDILIWMKNPQELNKIGESPKKDVNPFKKEIGARIRQLRKHLQLTQVEMVVNFRTGRAHYSRMESGEIFPGPEILKFLREHFNVSLDWLILGKGEMFLDQPLNDVKSGPVRKQIIQAEIPEQEAKEIKELLDFMQKFPMIKHSVLGFYWEYKLKNKNLIDEIAGEDGSDVSEG